MGERVLLVSNGHGEDTLGVILARALKEAAPSLDVVAFPVVGEGLRYYEDGWPVVGVQKMMPTGGLVREGWRAWTKDFRAGLLSLSLRQWRALRRLRDECDWAIAVGDIYPLWLCGAILARPVAFVPTAKSDYIRPHLAIEVAAMRRWCFAVFPRDGKTAANLAARNVPAFNAGNLMMDAVEHPEAPFDIPEGKAVVGLLPGSRAEAYDNLAFMLSVVERTDPRAFYFPVSLASDLDPNRAAERLVESGWTWIPAEMSTSEGAPHAADNGTSGWVGSLLKGDHVVPVYRRHFAAILHASQVVIGMSGTANEQAAGLGIPVLTCPRPGIQFSPKFVAVQKRLLGDALWVEEPEPEAMKRALLRLVTDGALRCHMQAVGRERMGPPGAAKRMAAQILAMRRAQCVGVG